MWPKSRAFQPNMAYSVAVLFLNFNRPRHTEGVLNRLRELQPARLYLHCDGPRSTHPDDVDMVAEVRALLETRIDWPCEVKTLFRPVNLGLRDGVSDAINWFFQQETEGVILEDDCVPDLSFFRFCQEMLELYRHDEQIMHIGGSNLAQNYTMQLPGSYVFTRFSFVWGWATWRRAWTNMSLSLEGLEEFKQSEFKKQFVVNGASRTYMQDKFEVTRQQRNHSWAYAWFYSILKNNGLCIVPTVNLVQNVGVGERTSTNTTEANKNARLVAGRLDFPLIHPLNRSIDPYLEQQFFYTSQKKRLRLLLWWVLKKAGLR